MYNTDPTAFYKFGSANLHRGRRRGGVQESGCAIGGRSSRHSRQEGSLYASFGADSWHKTTLA